MWETQDKVFLNSMLLLFCLLQLNFPLGLARPAEFKSKPGGLEENSYVLEWSVVSYSPVTAFRVETRREGVTAWAEASATPIPDGPYHFAGKHFLKEMEEATRYEARVSSRNDEGWSKPSPTFHFATKGAGWFRFRLFY